MRQRGPQKRTIETAFKFAIWAASLSRPPTRIEVQGFLQCSGPTAADWRRRWLRVLPTTNQAGGKRPSNAAQTHRETGSHE